MFFSDWQEKRGLQKQIDGVEHQYTTKFDLNKDDEYGLYCQMVDSETYDFRRKLSWLKEKPIRRAAQQLGIDIEKEWLESFDDSGALNRLSASGEAKLRRLIRQHKRENIEWWVKLITPIITVLTGPARFTAGVALFSR